MADELKSFLNPTAKEIADYFASLPPDTRVVIKDADTDWYMRFFHVKCAKDEEKDTVYLRARYYDQPKRS